MNDKIYTRKGDEGFTQLANGQQVLKNDLVLETDGALEELSSWIGYCLDQGVNTSVQEELKVILGHLLVVAGSLIGEVSSHQIAGFVAFLENHIDAKVAVLPPLRTFIIPAGHTTVSSLHLARTVCRRAERLVVALEHLERLPNPSIISYLNRLSDYLFILARYSAQRLLVTDMPWIPAGLATDPSDSV